jgi:hypothetical protein
VAVVIVVIPIAIGVPTVAVFVPPAMAFSPAALTRFAQFMARVIRLPAVPAVVLDGFVQSMVRFEDTSLATIVTLGGRAGCSRKCQHAKKRCGYQQGPSEELLLSPLKRHSLSILLFGPDWDGVTPVG